MAERRMFAKKVSDSDAFIKLSSAAQALYFHLCQGADDDGFNNQVNNALFKAHATVKHVTELVKGQLIIQFESGVIAVRHWRAHNALRKDRYVPTDFQKEMSLITLTDSGVYEVLCSEKELAPSGCQMVAERLPSGCQMVALGKDSIGKYSKDNVVVKDSAPARVENNNNDIPSKSEIYDFFKAQNEPKEADMFIAYNGAFSWEKAKLYGWKRIAMLWIARKKDKDKDNDKEASKKSASSIASFLFNKNDKAYTPEQINEFFTGFNPDEV